MELQYIVTGGSSSLSALLILKSQNPDSDTFLSPGGQRLQTRQVPDTRSVSWPGSGGGAQILTSSFQVDNFGWLSWLTYWHGHQIASIIVTRRVLVNKGEEGEVEGTHGLQMLDGSPLARLPTIPRFWNFQHRDWVMAHLPTIPRSSLLSKSSFANYRSGTSKIYREGGALTRDPSPPRRDAPNCAYCPW